MKDLYIAIVEELCGQYEDEGLSFNEAYERASNEAWDVMRDRLADISDRARQMQKDQLIDRANR